MTIKIRYPWLSLALIAFATVDAQLFRANAQGTAFTYQGRLSDGSGPANGVYDFQFRLAADPSASVYVGNPFVVGAVAVTNGLFTVTPNFGPGIFTGSNYWLEVDVRTNGVGAYVALAPLQRLRPTPYAVFATSSSNLLGALPASQLSGSIPNGNLPASPSFTGTVAANTFSGNGVNVSNVNALTLNGISAAGFWQLGGNNVSPGQFLGSTNNQSVEIRAGGQSAVRFEPTLGGGPPNIIAGSPGNSISAGTYGSMIGGGYFQNSESTGTVIGGGTANSIQSNSPLSSIVGGYLNLIQTNAYGSFIGGGQQNVIVGNTYSAIGGGYANDIRNSSASFIGGGAQNDIETANYAVIGGGVFNTNFNGNVTAIGGGWHNVINSLSDFSVIAGGVDNHISANTVGGTIGGGSNNFVSGISSTVSGGEYNSASAFRDTVGGGIQNTASGGISTVSGGWTNVASGNAATIGGGDHNQASGAAAVIAGGRQNWATGTASTVPGGQNNYAGGFASFAAGQNAYVYSQGTFLWADSQSFGFFSFTPDEFAVMAHNGMRIQSNVGIHLDGADRPIIVRDWDPFDYNAPNGKGGIGRWGLFMEPSILTIGIPELGGRGFQIARYNTNGTPTTLVSVDQSGNLLVANNVYAHGVLLTSDRDVKEHFTELDAKSVLSKVAALPITQWNYKDDGADNKHIGPVAQDFHAAFGLNGTDDKHISGVDEGGVALAAIQGLNEKLKEKDVEIEKLMLTNDRLAERLATLEATVKAMVK